MAKKLKWKRTHGSIVFIEKRTLGQRMRGLGFMQLAVTTLGISAVLLLIPFLAAVITGGKAPVWIGLFPAAALLVSAFGAYMTWYAHFHAGAKSRVPWTFGLFSNGAVAVLLVIMYIAGIFI